MSQLSLPDLLTRPCAADHFGLWMVEPQWFAAAAAAVRSGQWTPRQASGRSDAKPDEPGPKVVYHGYDQDGRPRVLYVVDQQGIVTVPIHGHMIKGDSSLGGTSTVRTRLALRTAYADPDVRGLMLYVDSPGGTAAGTPQLADDIRKLAQDGRKPIHGHAEDIMASAAYFAGSQASRLTVNATGEVGSIGTLALIEDSSGAAEQHGFTVHLLATGPFKGAFAPGVKVTEEHLAYGRERIEARTEPFIQAIKRGRGMSIEAARDLAYGDEGGKVWPAKRALELGLVDAIETDEQALAVLRETIREQAETRERESAGRRRRMRLAQTD